MNKLVAKNGYILVELFDKVNRKRSESAPFIEQTTSNNLGVVKHTDHEDFPVGTQVYFGDKYTRIMVGAYEMLAMKADDIIAKVVSLDYVPESK
jgi:hypothetical protein